MSSQPKNWSVIYKKMVWERPFVSVSMEQVSLPDGQVTMDWPKIYTQDYVNALILNEAGEAMILEGYKDDNSWSSWQLAGGYLEEDEDPYTAVQRELLEETGYSCAQWLYLGSYTIDANQQVGVGHFFFATGAQRIADPDLSNLEAIDVKWVPIKDLKYALVDGRISVISYAANIALALLLIEKQFPAML